MLGEPEQHHNSRTQIWFHRPGQPLMASEQRAGEMHSNPSRCSWRAGVGSQPQEQGRGTEETLQALLQCASKGRKSHALGAGHEQVTILLT